MPFWGYVLQKLQHEVEAAIAQDDDVVGTGVGVQPLLHLARTMNQVLL